MLAQHDTQPIMEVLKVVEEFLGEWMWIGVMNLIY